MDAEQTIAEIEWLDAHHCGAGHEIADRERPFGCQSKAR
jgi:hypothetical protein